MEFYAFIDGQVNAVLEAHKVIGKERFGKVFQPKNTSVS
jgi:hypothetical protein